MAKLNMTMSHKLPQDEAFRRIKVFVESAKVEFAGKISNLQECWDGYTGTFSFSTSGILISGELVVKDDQVELSGELPWLAEIYKDKIESTIRERVQASLI